MRTQIAQFRPYAAEQVLLLLEQTFVSWSAVLFRLAILIFLSALIVSGGAFASCLSPERMTDPVCAPQGLYVYVERKTITAGDPAIMVVAEVLAVNQISPPDGTPVLFTLQRGDATIDIMATTRAGIAYTYIDAGPLAGSSRLWASIGDLRSTAQRLDVLAGRPPNAWMTLSGCEQGITCEVQAMDLRDRYGNRVADGLKGQLLTWVDGQLVGQMSVATLRGQVHADWTPPAVGARLQLVFGRLIMTHKVASK